MWVIGTEREIRVGTDVGPDPDEVEARPGTVPGGRRWWG